MCGIVGVIITDDKATYQERNLMYKVFKQLLFIDTLRGSHGTGVYSIDKDTKDVDYYKKALNAPDFLQLNKTDKVIDGDVIVGHNRYATIGSHTDDNSHPFVHNSTIGVHNGTLSNWNQIDPGNKFIVDSSWLIDKLSTEGHSYLSKVDGAFAIVSYNQDENILSLIRNKDRPLWIAEVNLGYIFASEKEMLTLVLNRNNVKQKKMYQLKPWVHYKFQLEEMTLETESIKPFVKVETPKYNHNYNYGRISGRSNVSKGNVWDLPMPDDKPDEPNDTYAIDDDDDGIFEDPFSYVSYDTEKFNVVMIRDTTPIGHSGYGYSDLNLVVEDAKGTQYNAVLHNQTKKSVYQFRSLLEEYFYEARGYVQNGKVILTKAEPKYSEYELAIMEAERETDK